MAIRGTRQPRQDRRESDSEDTVNRPPSLGLWSRVTPVGCQQCERLRSRHGRQYSYPLLTINHFLRCLGGPQSRQGSCGSLGNHASLTTPGNIVEEAEMVALQTPRTGTRLRNPVVPSRSGENFCIVGDSSPPKAHTMFINGMQQIKTDGWMRQYEESFASS
jgi:hypothetical protein